MIPSRSGLLAQQTTVSRPTLKITEICTRTHIVIFSLCQMDVSV